MKTVCIYHSVDLDGWMSAAIVKHWFEYKNPNVLINKKDWDREKGINYTLDFIGYNYGEPIPDLSGYDKVIMCDISFPKSFMWDLWTNKGLNFIWIDHHISAINDMDSLLGDYILSYPIQGLRDTNFAACELAWKYFFTEEPMPEIVRLLGRYDCFGHKGTDEEQKVLEFQYGARQCISNYKEAYYYLTNKFDIENKLLFPQIFEKGKAIYQYLCTEAKQIYKNGFEIELTYQFRENPDRYTKVKFLVINKERFNPINFGIDYHKDGYDGVACFWYNGQTKLWNFSLYNDNGKVDCSLVAKQYGGGGHKGAAGFIVKDLKTIF